MIDRHHLVPKSRLKNGKKKMARNILYIEREKHVIWHKLFKDLTLGEVIGLLQRVQRIKSRKEG